LKKILLTQKQIKDKNGATCDCLEKNYIDYFGDHRFIPVPMPNNPMAFKEMIKDKSLVVFTGGSDPFKDCMRSLTENVLLGAAIKLGIPVLGICRGLQFINHYYGGCLAKTPETHKKLHRIVINSDTLPFEGNVNSFHDFCVKPQTVAVDLSVFAKSDDDVVEGLYWSENKVIAVQWHPERGGMDEWINDNILNVLKEWMK